VYGPGYLVSTVNARWIGALVLGFYDGGTLTYAGRVGTGFTTRALPRFGSSYSHSAPISRLSPKLLARKGVVWIQPELVVEVKLRGWTGDGLVPPRVVQGDFRSGERRESPRHSFGGNRCCDRGGPPMASVGRRLEM
jgi:ATP-dependent DNA ligase